MTRGGSEQRAAGRRSPARCSLPAARSVTDPRQRAHRRGKAERRDRQDADVRQLLVGDPGRAGVAHGGMRSSFEPGADREGDFHQAARFLVERSGVVALVREGVERFPHLGVRRSEVGHEGGNFRRHRFTSHDSVS